MHLASPFLRTVSNQCHLALSLPPRLLHGIFSFVELALSHILLAMSWTNGTRVEVLREVDCNGYLYTVALGHGWGRVS